ncbi:hypothetical protein [Lutispora sp.]
MNYAISKKTTHIADETLNAFDDDKYGISNSKIPKTVKNEQYQIL